MPPIKAEYQHRGPVPQDVVAAVTFEAPPLLEGQVRLEMLAAPINPSDLLTLKAPVQATYPIQDIKAAIAAATSSQRDGKVVLVGESFGT
jgi:NADPH:quinone reductase-like Zn-dependent oxidoreductase